MFIKTEINKIVTKMLQPILSDKYNSNINFINEFDCQFYISIYDFDDEN